MKNMSQRKMKKMEAKNKEEPQPFFLGKVEHTDGRVTYQEFVTHGEARRFAQHDQSIIRIYKFLSEGREAIIFER